MNKPNERTPGQAPGEPAGQHGLQIEFLDPAPLRLHPLHKVLPTVQMDSIEWHAFVDAASAAGPDGLPPIYVTPEGFVIDGERRWKAAKQLQWPRIACIKRQDWEAAALIVDSLLGQRHYSKGAKVYLCLNLLKEFVQSAETRRLSNLKRGIKTLEKPLNPPKSIQSTSEKGIDELCERLGCRRDLYFQAVRIRRIFELPSLQEHKFHFQDGTEKTLREHFEPRILDPEEPMGLGEVLKGIGWFVDANGKPLEHAAPARNSHLFYWQRGWQGWAKQCGRWEGLDNEQRAQAVAVVKEAVRDVPDQVIALLQDIASEEKKRRKKADARAEERKAA